jgi:probable rRNA maturation factor
MSSDGTTVVFRRAPAGLRRRVIESFARKLERELTRGRAFDCLITGDRELRRLNREFRGKDEATDVLSFAAMGADVLSTETAALGDIAISLARAREQGRRFGHTTEDEIRILMLHGVLHLTGMDHESDGGRMARAEKRWRARLGLPAGLIERVRA